MAASESHIVISMNLDTYVPYPWLGSWDSPDPLNERFPTDMSIIEVMSLDKTPWNNLYHRSSFLPSLGEMPLCLEAFVSHCPMYPLQTSILVHEVLSKGNMGNVTATLPIDLSIQPEIVKIFQLGELFPLLEINFFLPPFTRFFLFLRLIFSCLLSRDFFTESLSFAHYRHGVFILWLITLPRPGGMGS